MLSLYQRLRSAKTCCKGLNRNSFSDIQKISKDAFSNLEDIQRQVLTDPSPQLFEEEQAARASWIFFAAAEEYFLLDGENTRVYDPGLVKEMAPEYYSNLLGSEN